MMSRYYGNDERRRPDRRTSFDWRVPSFRPSRSDSHENLSRLRPLRDPARLAAYDDLMPRHPPRPAFLEPSRRHNRGERYRISEQGLPGYGVPDFEPVIATSFSANHPQGPNEPDVEPQQRFYNEDRNERVAPFFKVEERERRDSPPPPAHHSAYEDDYDDHPRVFVVNERGAADGARGGSRSRSSSRSRGWMRGPGIEDMDMYDCFEFECPRPEPFKNGDASDFDTPSLDTSTAALDEKQTIKGTNATGIYTSRYSGDAELGGRHEALLTSIHNPKGIGRPLFRWLHIQQDVMNFDEFWVELSRQVHLSEKERVAVGRLRADVKRQCIKSRHNSKGYKVGYMEPRYMEATIEKSDKKADTIHDDRPPAAKWICLPYFVLRQYSGLLDGSNLSAFPTQTLLQAQYSRSTQQRDMSQAVCELGTANKGECFHIAQLWCLILDDGLLVTCGAMSKRELQADTVKVNSEPSPTVLGSTSLRRIIVRYTDAVKWIFTPEECPTWFDFISRFVAFWPQSLEFRRNNIVIAAKDWPKLLSYLNSNRHASVTLTMTVIRHPEPPTRNPPNLDAKKEKGILESKDTKSATTSPRPAAMLELVNFKANQTAKQTESDSDLTSQLASAEKFLQEQTPYATQTAYASCRETTRDKIVLLLAAESTRVEEQKDDDLRRRHDQDLALFNMADSLFQLFLPADFEGPTVKKFWGAVMDFCTARGDNAALNHYVLRARVTSLAAHLEDLWSEIRGFEDIMSFMSDGTRAKIEPPRQFVTSWLHVLSGMVLCQQGRREWATHFTRVLNLLVDGMQRVIQSVSTHKLLDSCTVLPLEVASLTALNLLQDQVGTADDISETYSQYLNSLDTEITTQPSDRSYQHRIDLVRQEMTAIRRTVGQQRHIIASLRQDVHPKALIELYRPVDDEVGGRRAGPVGRHEQPHNEIVRYDRPGRDDGLDGRLLDELEWDSKLSPTEKSGFRGLFLSECARFLEQKAYEFRRYADYADDLERAVAYKMEWTKDRQENAVYAFTVVTIVFLPLSAIASIFGMNTADVRDLPYSQWMYWVVALPVTISTIVFGLWWMGELGNVFRWITGRQPTVGAPSSGYATFVVPDNDAYYGVGAGSGGGGHQPQRPTPHRMQEYMVAEESRRDRPHISSSSTAPQWARRRGVRRALNTRY